MTNKKKTRQETARLIAACAEIIAVNGWCQGDRFDEQGRCCIMGAGGIVYRESPVSNEVSGLAAKALHDVIGSEYIVAWNDAKGRTEDEVICALLAASMEVGSDA